MFPCSFLKNPYRFKKKKKKSVKIANSSRPQQPKCPLTTKCFSSVCKSKNCSDVNAPPSPLCSPILRETPCLSTYSHV